jgi:hypothetical protein
MEYRMHAAPHLRGSDVLLESLLYMREAEKADQLRLFGFRKNSFLPQ